MSRAAGFTLVEVLVALVILAVTGVAALQLFGGGLRLVGASGDHMGATLLASAKLSEVGADNLEEGATLGQEGAYRWTRRVALEPALSPFPSTRADATADAVTDIAKIRLARVTVEVEWGKSHRLEMASLRAWSAK